LVILGKWWNVIYVIYIPIYGEFRIINNRIFEKIGFLT
jgi:hypothetical protein